MTPTEARRAPNGDYEYRDSKGRWRIYCEARTSAQIFGASWASSTESCGRYAVLGGRLCAQHQRMQDKEGGVA